MNPTVQVESPDRLWIREGGGWLAAFGLPFLAAGLLMLAAAAGAVPVEPGDLRPPQARLVLGVMGLLFTTVGGGFALGRRWTQIDRAARRVSRAWGLLVPMRTSELPSVDATAVRLAFVEGDSDQQDRYPVAFVSPAGELPLATFTDYARARACVRIVAEMFALDVEDASTDETVRVPAAEMDLPLRDRWRRQRRADADPMPPVERQSEVSRDVDETHIRIPLQRAHPLALAAGLLPVAVPLVAGPSLVAFFRQSRTPDVVAWGFLGFLAFVFGVLPVLGIVNAVLRSSRGATLVGVSRRGLRIRERGAWTTRTIAALEASEILDLHIGSRDARMTAARQDAVREIARRGMTAPDAPVPQMPRLLTMLGRFARAKGVVVKARSGLFSFGRALADDEIRYLHAVVRRALVE